MAEYAAHTADILARLGPSAVPADADLTIEQQVTDDDEVVDHYHVRITNGSARVVEGPAPSPDITITQDADTARALRSGEIHAQRAFLTGKLSINGDIDKLLANGPLLTSLLRDPNA